MNLVARTALGALLVGGLAVSAPSVAGSHAKDEGKTGTIVEVAASKESFSTLVTAIKAAGLVDTLNGTGPFTVFAPTNEAFAKLPAGTLDNLLKPENKDQLVAVLTYHVVPGKVMASDVIKLDKAPTVNGKAVTITTADGQVMIDSATVTATDVAASNGVIHVIDMVILPQ